MTYEDTIKAQCRAERKFQDKKDAELRLAKEIIHSEELTPDEKYFRLITECGYGTDRAQQLIYGKIIYRKGKYQNKAIDSSMEKFYAK